MRKLSKKERKEARNDLKILYGDPPHDTWSNHCYGDGYYANSLKRKWGMSLEELEITSNYDKWKAFKTLAYAAYIKLLREKDETIN